VQGILADGAQVRCGAQLKLRGFERRKRPFEVILVRFPGGVERREREVVFSHVSYLLDKKGEEKSVVQPESVLLFSSFLTDYHKKR
jgi:hypothetical protein